MKRPVDGPKSWRQRSIIGSQMSSPVYTGLMPCWCRYTRKSPKPQPTSSRRAPSKSPSCIKASKRFSCDERLRKPRPRWPKPCSRTFSAYQPAGPSGSKAFIFVDPRGFAQQRAAARAAIEQEVQRGQALDERRLAALLVLGLLELLPQHAHVRGAEGREVEIVARAAHAAEERARADALAHVQQQLGALALHAELGAAHHRRRDAE